MCALLLLLYTCKSLVLTIVVATWFVSLFRECLSVLETCFSCHENFCIK